MLLGSASGISVTYCCRTWRSVRIYPWRRIRRSRAPSSGPGTFFAAQFSAGCTTNISGFDLRQAQVVLVGGIDAGKSRLPASRFQREDRDGRVPAADLGCHLVVIAAHESRDRGDVLLAARGATHHAARHRTANIVPVEDLAVLGVEHEEVASDLAGEDHVAAADRYAADHRLAGLIVPPRRAGGGVERGQPATRVGPGIELEVAAEELAPLLLRLRIGRLRCWSELVAPIGRRHEQCAEQRAVGGAVPLVTATEARP